MGLLRPAASHSFLLSLRYSWALVPSGKLSLLSRGGFNSRLAVYVAADDCASQRDSLDRGLPALPLGVGAARLPART